MGHLTLITMHEKYDAQGPNTRYPKRKGSASRYRKWRLQNLICGCVQELGVDDSGEK